MPGKVSLALREWGAVNSISAIRATLKTGATVFGLSAVLLLLLPDVFIDLLALPQSDELSWAMRMIGITLVALTGNMFVVASTASNSGVTKAAVVMLIAATTLGVLTLLIPVELNLFASIYAAVGFGFGLTYGTLLLRSKRSR